MVRERLGTEMCSHSLPHPHPQKSPVITGPLSPPCLPFLKKSDSSAWESSCWVELDVEEERFFFSFFLSFFFFFLVADGDWVASGHEEREERKRGFNECGFELCTWLPLNPPRGVTKEWNCLLITLADGLCFWCRSGTGSCVATFY